MKIPANTTNRFQLWEMIINETKPKSFAEIGVWKGEFAEKILKQCPSISRYLMIDPWAQLPDWNKPYNVETKEFNKIYEEAMSRTEFAKDRVEVLRGRTKEVLSEIPDGSLDFVYIDGDHTLRGITIDLMRILPKMKKGAMIAGDDFFPGQHSGKFEPTLVCPFAVYFAEAKDLPVTALPHGQFVIENDPSKGFSFADATGNYGDLSLAPGQLAALVGKIENRVRKWLS